MKTKLLTLLLLALGGLVFTGCHHGAYAPKNTGQYDLENREPFVLMSQGAQNSVTVAGIQQRVLSDGRLQVVANVRNREERRIQVQISCVFKDSQGFATGDQTPWRDLILTENAQEAVQFVSMNDQAATFTIRVREAR